MIERNNRSGVVRPHRSKLIAVIRLFDILIIWLTLYLLLENYGYDFKYHQVLWLLIAVTCFEFFAEFNLLYNAPRGINLYRETQRTGLTWLGVFIVFLCIIQVKPNLIAGPDGTVFWYWLVLAPLTLVGWHLAMRLSINYMRGAGENTRKVAIVGATNLGFELESIFEREAWLGYSFAGYYDDRTKKEDGRLQRAEQGLSGNINELIQMVNEQKIDAIYITLPLKAEDRIKQILSALSDTTAAVYYVPDLFGFDLLRAKMENLRGIPIISVHDTPFYGIDGFSKRMFDIIVSTLILVVISIPLLIIALGVKITSPGPAMFKQRRYGFKGEEITVWKFRSMTVAEDGDKVKQATKNDARITEFGAFLRRTSLDELPQFINVLQGRMSIIGPRPHAVAHNEFYRGQIKGYMLRHKVKPGITGLAQISGYRGETETLDKMDGRIRYDLEYIRNWSLMLDCKIFLKTIFNGFFSDQAY